MLLFLAYLLLALGPVPKLVLCIGEDGHVALEADPAADCACRAGTSCLTSQCSACVDIPILSGAGPAVSGDMRSAMQGGLPLHPTAILGSRADGSGDFGPLNPLWNSPERRIPGRSPLILPLRL